MSRERALNQIVALRRLAEDQTTTEGERQAARDTMAKLRAKYDIPERQQTGGAEYLRRMAETFERNQREKLRREAAAQAARAEQERIAWGASLTDAERAWARRDPLGFASSRDKRTHTQKQQDMNGSWGQRDRGADPSQPWCATPETYFDRGGEPRKRNQHQVACDRCSRSLLPGEGCIFQVAGNWIGRCCEMRPGPRQQRSRSRR